MPLHCQGSRCLPASVPCLLITSRYVCVCRADRFLRVQVQRGKWCSDSGKAAIQHLATHGLSFACRRYRYIGHKVTPPPLNLITSKPMYRACRMGCGCEGLTLSSNVNNSISCLMQDPSRGECYMVAEESLGREGPHFQPLTSDRAIGLLGDFNHFPSLSKMAARVALGFSRSWTLELVRSWPNIHKVDSTCE